MPTGMQNVAESAVDFVEDGIVMETIGPDGLKFTPFLLTLFTFIFVCNIWEHHPRRADAGERPHRPAGLHGHPGVVHLPRRRHHEPGPDQVLQVGHLPAGRAQGDPTCSCSSIELLGILVTRPLSLAVRLFANMLAGHLLLVSFAVLCRRCSTATKSASSLPFALLVLTGFEILVAFLQAYIFTILAAVYIGGAMHPEH